MNRKFMGETQASNRHVKRCSKLLVSKELEMKAGTSHLTLLRWADRWNLSITSVPTCVEAQDFSYLQWAAWNGTTTLEGNWAAFSEVKNPCSYSLQSDSFKAGGKGACSPAHTVRSRQSRLCPSGGRLSNKENHHIYGDSSLSGIWTF